MMGWNRDVASRVGRSAFCGSVPPATADSSLVWMLRSALAFSRPAAARSLKDLSPRPPMSNARPTLTFFLAAPLAEVAPPVAAPPPPALLLLLLLLQAANTIAAAAATAPSFTPRDTRKIVLPSAQQLARRSAASGTCRHASARA